jgi:hypothetical protein
MPIELIEIGTSAGIGIIDNILVELEEQGKLTREQTFIKDGIRVAGTVGGLVISAFVARPGSTLDKVSSSLTLSSLPLALHTIRRRVKEMMITRGFGSRYELESLGHGGVPSRPVTITSY